ncbi:MAG TPA: RelA/SpoT domain-containing protein [Solirubrobacterales bacterium]|nr:RelA/SpoT domain-containing protein [Solirubrobacterales bacterium]
MASYSKTKVDRAGQRLAEALRLALAGDQEVGPDAPEVREAIEIVEWWRGAHARPLSRVAANLRYYAAEEGKPVVAQRLKKFPTIAGKLLREPTMKLSRMADIGGVRAVVPDQGAAYRIANRLRRNWTITRFRDYVAEPKSDGYRALHLINRNRGRLIEVQLRTANQDFWANGVEMFSRSIAPGLKFGEGPPGLREYFKMLGAFLDMRDRGVEVTPEFLARLKELHQRVDTVVDRETSES